MSGEQATSAFTSTNIIVSFLCGRSYKMRKISAQFKNKTRNMGTSGGTGGPRDTGLREGKQSASSSHSLLSRVRDLERAGGLLLSPPWPASSSHRAAPQLVTQGDKGGAELKGLRSRVAGLGGAHQVPQQAGCTGGTARREKRKAGAVPREGSGSAFLGRGGEAGMRCPAI